jgi:undecaprenyl diphosphate synthase
MPKSIAVIMDGNRRYAKSLGIPQYEGHKLGVGRVKELVRWARDAGVSEVILYAFSTENWNRASEEVGYLMTLFSDTFGGKDAEELLAEGCRVDFIGQRERLPSGLRTKMEDLEKRSKGNTAVRLIVGISYGGRAELVTAVNKLLSEGVTRVDEDTLRRFMWTADILDPDLVIRTGGDRRLSNFLPWQSVYSELFFTDTFWPAFTKEEFDSILAEFGTRERRHGK